MSVLDLGPMPPCENFLSADELDLPEWTYPLHLRVCEDCLLLQIPAGNEPTDWAHFWPRDDVSARRSAESVDRAAAQLGLGPDSFIVDVADRGGYGSTDRGLLTSTGELNQQLAARIRDEHGPADLVVADDVLARRPDLVSVTRSLRTLLDDDGCLSFEVPHALNLVEHGLFALVHPEQFQYFTLFSTCRALATAGLAIVDVELDGAIDGSMHVWARPTAEAGPPSGRVLEVLRAEQAAGLHHASGYSKVRRRAESIRHALLCFLLDCRAEGRRAVGYGALASGNVLLNYCGIRSDLLEYTVERDPHKHARFTPGTRIPVYEPEEIVKDRPDVVLALSWNREADLHEELAYIAEWGGQLIIPLPTLHRAKLTLTASQGCER